MMRWLQRLLLAVAGALLVAVVAGWAWQSQQASADRARFPAPGRIVDVDGVAMHIDCRGSGSPTVVIESGLNSGSSSWRLVHDRAAEATRVCAYDRPGMDWSAPDNRESSAVEVADRLHALLAAAGEEGPRILLGMSAGGVYVRAYQRRHPEDVVGMILVDSSHEQQGNRLPDLSGAVDLESLLTACAWLQPVGVVRAFRLLDPIFDQYDVPASYKSLIKAHAYQSYTCAAMLEESAAFEQDIHDPAPPAPLGDLPLIVLSQGADPEADEAFGLTLEQARELRRAWDILQEELTALSSRGERIVAHQSGHVIQLDQPAVVVNAIRRMARDLRSAATTGAQRTSSRKTMRSASKPSSSAASSTATAVAG